MKRVTTVVLLCGLLAAAGSRAGQAPAGAASLRVLFAGDLAWGESYQDQYEKAGQGNILKQRGYDYSLEKLEPLLRVAQVVVANLETPVAATRESPFAGAKDYVHYADPIETPSALLRHNIRVVGLANNHTRDLGETGLTETLDLLVGKGIEVFGAGRDAAAARRPWHRRFRVGSASFSLYVIAGFEFRDQYDKQYEFYATSSRAGVAPIDTGILRAQVADIRRADKDAFIVYFPHWGENYKWRTEAQAATARACIDAGADLVVGHGAHMLQEIERYQGRWIVYSIGNFMFNAAGRYAANKVDPFGMPATLVVRPASRGVSVSLELQPIVSDNRITGYQPRPATPDEFERARAVLFEHSPGAASWGRLVTEGHDGDRRYLVVTVR